MAESLLQERIGFGSLCLLAGPLHVGLIILTEECGLACASRVIADSDHRVLVLVEIYDQGGPVAVGVDEGTQGYPVLLDLPSAGC